MSTQFVLQPPPPLEVTQQAYTTHSGHGSVGPVIGVLALITVLGVIAGMIGRLCSGRRVMGLGGHYDIETWLEIKCSSCLDGTLVPPPPRPRPPPPPTPTEPETNAAGDDSPPVEAPQDIREEDEEEEEQQQPRHSSQQGHGS